ncbi:hypothetical protein AMTRI_Chr09g39610 [Amborella trichopoda]
MEQDQETFIFGDYNIDKRQVFLTTKLSFALVNIRPVDGPEAGQTVPHVHVHILPRQSGDFEKNDEIYDAVEGKEVNRKLDLDEDRKNRTITEMSQEASFLRALF